MEAGAAPATTLMLLDTADASTAEVARLLPTLTDEVQVLLGSAGRSALQLALPRPELPDAERLLRAIAALVEEHLTRSGLLPSADSADSADSSPTSHA